MAKPTIEIQFPHPADPGLMSRVLNFAEDVYRDTRESGIASIDETDNAVRVVDAFVEKLDLLSIGFDGVEPSATGRPAYHPAVLLKLYIYGYLNSLQSGRRLEQEAQRNVELMWLTGRLMPVFKTITGFRKENRQAIRKVCLSFVELCRELDLFSAKLVAIDEEEPEIRELTAEELRQKIASMEAKKVLQAKTLKVVADAGYYEGKAIAKCYAADITALVPKTDTTNRKAKGQYTKADFNYDAKHNEYICPAGQRLTYRFEGRNEPSCTGLQHETGDQGAWYRENHRCTATGVKTKHFLPCCYR